MGWVVNVTPWPLYPRERPGTHCIGGWMGPRTGLDGGGNSRSHRDSILGPSSPWRVAIPAALSRPYVHFRIQAKILKCKLLVVTGYNNVSFPDLFKGVLSTAEICILERQCQRKWRLGKDVDRTRWGPSYGTFPSFLLCVLRYTESNNFRIAGF